MLVKMLHVIFDDFTFVFFFSRLSGLNINMQVDHATSHVPCLKKAEHIVTSVSRMDPYST